MNKTIVRTLVAAALLLFTSGCASGHDTTSGNLSTEGTTTTMTDQPTDLWGLISATTAQAPLTNDKINALFATQLQGTGRRDVGPTVAVGGIRIKEVSSFIRDDGTWVFTNFDIDEPGCISLDEVKAHYSDIKKTNMPRGRSLEERHVWTSWQPWGTLNFGFPDRDYCLAGFSLYALGEYTRQPFPTR